MLGRDIGIVQVADDLCATPKALHNKAQGQPRSGATLGYEK
jgi:hypothetical protein